MMSDLPNYEYFMRPMLQVLSDGKEWRVKDLLETVANAGNFSKEQHEQRLPSGHTTLLNRISWAKTYLRKAGLIESRIRGFVSLTERGKTALAGKEEINSKYLEQFPEFNNFRDNNLSINVADNVETTESKTPEELIVFASNKLKQALAEELLARLHDCPPAFFEKVVIDLLVAMGYGGSFDEAAKALGRSGDGGVDGIIKEDRLGLDVIYLQAKRWQGSVGREIVQAFVGSLQGLKATKGVLLTTSHFTREAIEYSNQVNTRIILIDGDQLTNLMIEHGVGVSTEAKYEIKRLDEDYFSEDV